MRTQRDRELFAVGLFAVACACAVADATPAPPPAVAAPAKTPAPAATPAQDPAPKQGGAQVLHLALKARANSTYSLAARFDIANRDVTFEAPDAYKQGFDYWAGRMKGQKRSEVYEITTVTQDADKSGRIPFRRTIPRFDLEFERQGEMFAAN